MLKALRRFTQLLRVHIYVPGCCKYIRMTNGLQPLVELCMDGCYADLFAVQLERPNVCLRQFGGKAKGRFCTTTIPSAAKASSEIGSNFHSTWSRHDQSQVYISGKV